MTTPTESFGSTDKIRILGIGGSTRRISRNRVVTKQVLELARDAGAETLFADVRALALPVYDEDIPYEDQPESLHWLIAQIQAADGFIINSPNYHGTLSGAVKNALDAVHIMRGANGSYFDGRPVGLIGYGGSTTANVINALSHSVRGMRGLIVPTTVAVTSNDLEMTGDNGRIISDQVVARSRALITEVLDIAELRRLRHQISLAAD